MSATLERIEQEALALSPKDRARLVDKLWDSLGDTTYPELSEEWKVEIERRCREIDEGKVRLLPGEEVSRRAWERLKSSRR